MSRKPFWLTDQRWSRIESHLPADVRGKARVDDRRVISGIVHVLKSGWWWCDCPPEYGPPTTVYNRFVRWAERGVWGNLFLALAGKGRSMDMQMIDSTHIKAHRSAAGGKGGAKAGDWPLERRSRPKKPCDYPADQFEHVSHEAEHRPIRGFMPVGQSLR